MSAQKVIHRLTAVDSSGRISLGKSRAGCLYDVALESDGKMTLTPMVAIPQRELWLHRNAAVKAMVEEGLAEMDRGEVGPIDLGAYPGDDEEE